MGGSGYLQTQDAGTAGGQQYHARTSAVTVPGVRPTPPRPARNRQSQCAMTDSWDDRRKTRRAEIEARLRRVRGAMTDVEFERLVSAVMRTAERFADID